MIKKIIKIFIYFSSFVDAAHILFKNEKVCPKKLVNSVPLKNQTECYSVLLGQLKDIFEGVRCGRFLPFNYCA